MKIYVVIVDGTLSQEGYLVQKKAIDFILNRNDRPKQDITNGSIWRFKSDIHTYLIKEVVIN